MNFRLGHFLKRCYFYISWPGLALYFALQPRARVMITDASGRLLLVQGMWKKWYDDEDWSLPGGGIGWGELPARAASREVGEELGLVVTAADMRPLTREWLSERGIGGRVYIFGLTVANDVPLVPQVHEVAAAKWYTADELQTMPLRPDARRALRLLAGTR